MDLPDPAIQEGSGIYCGGPSVAANHESWKLFMGATNSRHLIPRQDSSDKTHQCLTVHVNTRTTHEVMVIQPWCVPVATTRLMECKPHTYNLVGPMCSCVRQRMHTFRCNATSAAKNLHAWPKLAPCTSSAPLHHHRPLTPPYSSPPPGSPAPPCPPGPP